MSTRRTPAYDVLFCQDILTEILSHLSPGWFLGEFYDFKFNAPQMQRDLEARKICQRNLVACALTCRAFSDLALAELWRVLDHHIILLKLLPWMTDDDPLDEVFYLKRNIGEKAWSRFRWYARLVREMKISVGTDIKIRVHRNTWTVLALRLQGEPLLPTLRRLQVLANVDDIVPFLFSMSPTVRMFTLEFNRSSSSIAESRNFVHPFLTLISDPPGHPLNYSVCLALGLRVASEEVVQHLRKCTRLSMLKDLDLTQIQEEVEIHPKSIAALSRLPSLHTLNIRLSLQDPSSTATSPFSFAGLAHLRVLKLPPLPLPTLSLILAASGLRACPLRSLAIECTARHTDDMLVPKVGPPYLEAIRAALPDALESLHVVVMCRARAEPPLPLSTFFAPFLSLGQLKSFDVAFRWGYVPHVADGDLCALADAWPRLEVLSVWVWEMRAPDFSGARPPTVAGLVELAGGCPRLREVTLPALNVSVLPEISTLPREGYSTVWFLDVSALVHDEGVAVDDVARILDALFPSLTEYSRAVAGSGSGRPQARSWHVVQDTMRAIQAARRGIPRQ